jgi:hypothetical protein
MKAQPSSNHNLKSVTLVLSGHPTQDVIAIRFSPFDITLQLCRYRAFCS